MNYSLDPLHAITARPLWLQNSPGFNNIGISTNGRIAKPKAKKKVKQKPALPMRYPIRALADDLGIHYDTIVSISRKVIGKGGFLTKDEFDRLKHHLSGIKIRRRMKRKT